MARKKRSEFTYSVKIKVHIPGYQKKYITGICFTETPDKAKALSLAHVIEGVNKQVNGIENIDPYVTAVNCERIKDDFIVTPSKN